MENLPLRAVLVGCRGIRDLDLARSLTGSTAALAVTCHEWNPPGSWDRQAAVESAGHGARLEIPA